MSDQPKSPIAHPAASPAQRGPATAPLPNGNGNARNADAGPSTPLPRPIANGHGNGGADPAGLDVPPPPEAGHEDRDDVDVSHAFAQRREEELARRDRSLAEFLVMLDGYKPLIPEQVTEYYLQRAGFDCSDPRLKRLLSLSAQKFVSDLARDAFHFAKLRINSTPVGRGRPAAGADRNRVVLTMDDLSLALSEHGVNVKKPDYYI